MNNSVLEYENQVIGKLSLLDYVPQYGAPIQADLYYPTYQLDLSDKPIQGTYHNSFLVTAQSLFITELFLEIQPDGSGSFLKTELVKIDLQSHQKKTLSQMIRGYVLPKSIESGKIIYCKEDMSGSMSSEFEQSI